MLVTSVMCWMTSLMTLKIKVRGNPPSQNISNNKKYKIIIIIIIIIIITITMILIITMMIIIIIITIIIIIIINNNNNNNDNNNVLYVRPILQLPNICSDFFIIIIGLLLLILIFLQNYWTITINIKLSSTCSVACSGFEWNISTVIRLNSSYVFENAAGNGNKKTRSESNSARDV